MLIKQSSLSIKLPKTFPAVWFLIGQEPYQLNAFAAAIKKQWHEQKNEVDCSIIDIVTPSDWLLLEQKANSYSLFSEAIMVDARYDKKTWDAMGKTVLDRYLKVVNPNCLVLIRAAELPLKQVQSVANNELVNIMLFSSPSPMVVKQWISEQLQKMVNQYDPQLPGLIQQYTDGNLLATAQLLDKLALIVDANQFLSIDEVKEHLSNQCAYSLFELADCCLQGNAIKCIQLLRQASVDKTEPTLVLWIFSQEVRLLLQLLQLTQEHHQSFRDSASQLKIWSHRIPIYQAAIKRYSIDLLIFLLRLCKELDGQIKSSQNKQIWQSFEILALSLCTGKKLKYD